MATKNMENWDSKRLLLADPRLKPGSKCIQDASDRFRELLEIRYSSPLFRLRSREEVQSQLTFLNTGPDQVTLTLIQLFLQCAPLQLDLAMIAIAFKQRLFSRIHSPRGPISMSLQNERLNCILHAMVIHSQTDSCI